MSAFDLLPALLRGAQLTVVLAVAAGALAIAVSFIAGLARLSPVRPVRMAVAVYVEVFRGTSALVQVFYFFFVLPLIGIQLPAFAAGVIALGLNFGAYGSEIVRAAILNVDRGQREAAIALNMPPALTMRRIILPQALAAMLPSFGNLVIDLLKATSLLSLITLSEMTFAGKMLVQGQGRVTEVYVLVLLIYFIIAVALGRVFKLAEQRVVAGLHLGPRR
jgi:polar amino acid transport system permease protein